jgi:tetratricopeptide (TPR) repeat protein
VSDEKPKAGPAGAAAAGPPRLDRVPAGYRPPAVARSASAAAAPPPATPPPAAPPPAAPPTPVAAPAPAVAAPARPAPPSATGAPAASYGLAAREVGADVAMAAGLAHQGSLSNESPLRLFALAAALQATGRLTLSPEGRVYALAFRRGTVEHASSSEPQDDLGRFLVARGALSEDQRVRAEGAKARASGDLAAALVAERLVNPADVARLLQEHGTAIVQRALALDSGGWAWKPDATPPPSAFPLGAPFAMLCAAVRGLDAAALLRRLGEREHRAAARVGGRIRAEDLRLTPQEARAAQIFDGVRSPAELAAASPADTLVVLRLALLLAETDLLAFGAERKGAAAGSPAPAPSTPARPAAPSAAAPASGPRPTPPRPTQSNAAAPTAPRAAPPRPANAAAPTSLGAAPLRPTQSNAPGPVGSGSTPTAGPMNPAPPATAAPRPPAPVTPPAPSPLDRASLDARVKKLAEADHFAVLGVDRAAAGAQIKAAYFQLAKTYHPDAVPADAPADVRKLCADVFAKVSEAWSVLGEDASRAAYLEQLKSGGPANVDVMAIFQAENLFQAGTMLVKARKYDEALQKIDEAIGLYPDEPEFSMWKAWCEFLLAAEKKRQLAPCAAAIEAALKRNPRCAQGYLFLGQMAKIAGDLSLAEKQLKRGLAVAPEHQELQRELKYLRK